MPTTTVKFTTQKCNLRTIRKGEPDFLIKDGLIYSPRAGFELNPHIPEGYKRVILECIQNDWLKPVAHIYDSELAWDKLNGR